MPRLRTAATIALLSLGLSGCVLPPPPSAYGGGPQGGGPHGGPEAGYARGDRLAPQYMGGGYAVHDPGARGLQQPPHGYGWFAVDGQFVLAAITTGVIASVLFLGPRR